MKKSKSKAKPSKVKTSHSIRCSGCNRLKPKIEFPMVSGADGKKHHSPTCNKCMGKGKAKSTSSGLPGMGSAPAPSKFGNFHLPKTGIGAPTIQQRPEDFKDVIASLDKPISHK